MQTFLHLAYKDVMLEDFVGLFEGQAHSELLVDLCLSGSGCLGYCLPFQNLDLAFCRLNRQTLNPQKALRP